MEKEENVLSSNAVKITQGNACSVPALWLLRKSKDNSSRTESSHKQVLSVGSKAKGRTWCILPGEMAQEAGQRLAHTTWSSSLPLNLRIQIWAHRSSPKDHISALRYCPSLLPWFCPIVWHTDQWNGTEDTFLSPHSYWHPILTKRPAIHTSTGQTESLHKGEWIYIFISHPSNQNELKTSI